MRVIPTRVHGILDYLMGLVLIASPWIFGFADGGARQWVPVALGVAALIYSVLTDYELGLARMIPMSIHLVLDFASGAFLAASPWIFGFADDVWVPHVVLGLIEIGAVLMSETEPRDVVRTRPTEYASGQHS